MTDEEILLRIHGSPTDGEDQMKMHKNTWYNHLAWVEHVLERMKKWTPRAIERHNRLEPDMPYEAIISTLVRDVVARRILCQNSYVMFVDHARSDAYRNGTLIKHEMDALDAILIGQGRIYDNDEIMEKD